MLVLFIAVWMIGTVSIQARCAEAARIGARAAARGESDVTVRSFSARAAPRGATISISRGDDIVMVRVRYSASAPLGLGGVTPAIDITMSSTAPTEPIPVTEFPIQTSTRFMKG